MIPFHKPYITGNELKYIKQVLKTANLSGNKGFTQRCHAWFENSLPCKKALLTHSGTAALEMAAILTGIKHGDEVIMPSFTFVSTANPFVLRGAVPVFVDIRNDTLNIDETKIEAAVTKKTKAIAVVHYAGVSCEMEKIMRIAAKYNLVVIEDAAQSLGSYYKDKHTGTTGHFGCFSFHETKNITSGEGGALIINDNKYIERAEIIWEKGTDRTRFLRGEIDKYTWVDIGSSFLPSELNAAFLLAQLENLQRVNNKRQKIWQYYYNSLEEAAKYYSLKLPEIPGYCRHNAHIFYFMLPEGEKNHKMIEYMKKHHIAAHSHYIPLHLSAAGKKYGRKAQSLKITESIYERLMRLPIHASVKKREREKVIETVKKYFSK